MNAMEKSAWTELAVVAVATLGVLSVLPWLGDRATGMFGLLGLLPLSMWWLRRRGDAVVTDERDQKIQMVSTHVGVHAAWMLSFMTLIVLVLWSSSSNDGLVPTRYLNWLIWIQFAVCYGVKAIVGVISYRRGSLAA